MGKTANDKTVSLKVYQFTMYSIVCCTFYDISLHRTKLKVSIQIVLEKQATVYTPALVTPPM